MNKLVLIVALTMAGQVFAAGQKDCPADKATWKQEAELKTMITEKYVTMAPAKPEEHLKEITAAKWSGNCYHVMGKTVAGKKAEMFFNPATGEAVETKIK